MDDIEKREGADYASTTTKRQSKLNAQGDGLTPENYASTTTKRQSKLNAQGDDLTPEKDFNPFLLKFKSAIQKTTNNIKQNFSKKPRSEGDGIFNDKQKGLLDDYESLDIEPGDGLFRAKTGLEERDVLLKYNPPLSIEVGVPVENTKDILEDTKIEVPVNNLTEPTIEGKENKAKKETKSLEALTRALPPVPTTALPVPERRDNQSKKRKPKRTKNKRVLGS